LGDGRPDRSVSFTGVGKRAEAMTNKARAKLAVAAVAATGIAVGMYVRWRPGQDQGFRILTGKQGDGDE